MPAAGKGAVCVTGAGGFIGSWVVQLLLSNDYPVHGTVRDPQDDDHNKYAHLKGLKGLKLFKADLTDYASLLSAIQGCSGVFHVASPVQSSSCSSKQEAEAEIIEPTVRGTLNVMKACAEAKVKRVVVVSSAAAVVLNPAWLEAGPVTHLIRSQLYLCIIVQEWYAVAKTEAEREAFEYGHRAGIEVVSICPTLVVGPVMNHAVPSGSSFVFSNFLKGISNLSIDRLMTVDVRDVAEAMVLMYEKPEAEGRYICTAHLLRIHDMFELLESLYPDLNYPNEFTEEQPPKLELSAEKLKKLGWSYRPFQETLVDSVESYRKAGILD
ncbi:unnamed protein product [Linum tenue]|uniref:NAD-dependent epimerase/dehydratase domain-containing protein n=3 Tax=Linum tenue TaxID=586396 RepID=A0AAV0M4J4_9ROSI|nr:unnamed protein product [Linum tenue]